MTRNNGDRIRMLHLYPMGDNPSGKDFYEVVPFERSMADQQMALDEKQDCLAGFPRAPDKDQEFSPGGLKNAYAQVGDEDDEDEDEVPSDPVDKLLESKRQPATTQKDGEIRFTISRDDFIKWFPNRTEAYAALLWLHETGKLVTVEGAIPRLGKFTWAIT